MSGNKFSGVITALVTPFKNGAVDLPSLKRVVHSQTEQGVNGFVVNGTTGESPTLSFDEVQSIYETVRAAAPDKTVIVGTGSNSTAKTVETTRKVMAWKPDGVLVVVPYYNRPPQRGLQLHFEEAAKASNVPVLLYNVPGRTVANLEPATAGRLSRVANIAGIKDATGDMKVLTQLRQECRDGFAFLSGDDGTCVDFCANGGHGVIGVASHIIGREMGEAMKKAAAGDKNIGEQYKDKYAPLMKYLYCEANPIPVKAALHFMGLIDSPEMRAPLVPLDEKFHKELQACLKNLGRM